MALTIGVAPCFFHADPTRPIFKGKTLLYMEEELSHWLIVGGALPHLLPTTTGVVEARDLLEDVDALVLQGGSDLSPTSYGEEPQRPEWKGDAVRDRNETALIRAAMEMDKPVLGVCRGLQMINVALGGTLQQDIIGHRDYEKYDKLQHDVTFEPGSLLGQRYGGTGGRVNSVHHQGINRLAPELIVEARAVPDGVIEAVRYAGEPFVYAVQWHPEFQKPSDTGLLDTAPLREMFFEAARVRC